MTIAAPLPGAGTPIEDAFTITGTLENRAIDEASGLQAGANGVFYTHNDGKRDVFVIDDLVWMGATGARRGPDPRVPRRDDMQMLRLWGGSLAAPGARSPALWSP